MYVGMYVSNYVGLYIYMSVDACIYVCDMHICMSVCLVWMYVCTDVCMHVRIFVCMYALCGIHMSCLYAECIFTSLSCIHTCVLIHAPILLVIAHDNNNIYDIIYHNVHFVYIYVYRITYEWLGDCRQVHARVSSPHFLFSPAHPL